MMATKAKTRVDRSAIGSNVRLTKALTHPLRVEIMRLFEQEPPAGKKWTEWSPVAVATELNSPIGNVSYHMRHLAELGFIRVGRTSNARGAVVHHYRKVARSGWDGLGPDGFEMELGGDHDGRDPRRRPASGGRRRQGPQARLPRRHGHGRDERERPRWRQVRSAGA
jgi:hypothetical protein